MLEILNNKETKQLKHAIESAFGYSPEGYYLTGGRRHRVYLFTGSQIPEITRIYSLGVYIGTVEKDGFRPSIDGAQLIGPHASSNVLEISKDLRRDWFLGNDLHVSCDQRGPYIILKCCNDFLGAGKLGSNVIYNYLPKDRRIRRPFDGDL